MDLRSADVLVIEDIIDSGVTARVILEQLTKLGAESVKICALLDKPAGRKLDITADYIGFSVPNRFVIGYGLDYKNKYRTLPYIAVLDERAGS